MGRHQRAETLGLVSFLICACLGAGAISLYLRLAPAIWQVTQRRFMAGAGVVAGCAVMSFCCGYASHSRSWSLSHGWFTPIRRLFEVFALSIVYAATTFLSSFALFGIISDMMGPTVFVGYLTPVCAVFAGVTGYMTFVQAEMMNAKTLASLLPFFVVAGVSTAGMTTDDPYWWHNNFSQLGDRTTFAARMFNSTLMLAGTCIIIVSYFAVSELITTERMRRIRARLDQHGGNGKKRREVSHFTLRIIILSMLLTITGLAFIGIGVFRYTPHPVLHNVCAQGLTVIMGVLMLTIPWLAPRLPKAMFVVSILAILLCVAVGVRTLLGFNSLTNLEALAGMIFLGWFIVFSRQIAAIEADRIQEQLILLQTLDPSESPIPDSFDDTDIITLSNDARPTDGIQSIARIQSRLASDK